MACYHPIYGWMSHDGRKRKFVPCKKENVPREHDLMAVPCGQCIGCRLNRSRQWAVRCMHEASLYEENCFITLTYDDPHLPENGSLVPRDFQLFMKRLRKAIEPRKVRFFHAGEYGEETRRPHYHACLFGWDFPDKVPFTTRNGYPVWLSALLQELWPFGLHEIGSVTFDSAAYVARYVMKKITGPIAEDHYVAVDGDTGECFRIEPEYCTMSRRPGIGKSWMDKFGAEVYPSDSVVMNGKLLKPPRYYDKLHMELDPTAHDAVCRERDRKRRREEEYPERLKAGEDVARARVKFLKRGLQ